MNKKECPCTFASPRQAIVSYKAFCPYCFLFLKQEPLKGMNRCPRCGKVYKYYSLNRKYGEEPCVKDAES